MKKIIFLSALLITAISCSKSDNNDDDNGGGDGFNRKALLENWVNNIVKPAFDSFDTKLAKLQNNQKTFVETPTEANLEVLQASLFEAQKVWQHVAVLNFGKAEEINYRGFMNTYPVDFITTANDSQEDDNTVDKNIEASDLPIADIDFTLNKRDNEQGFPTLDYLINGLGNTNTEILSFYTTNTLQQNYKDYLERVINRMVSLTDDMTTYWNTQHEKVIANDGSSETASLDRMANDFINYIEKGFREPKVAIPSGKRNGVKKPESVESFYSPENSKALFLESYKAIKNMYFGTAFTNGNEGEGIDDYLIFLDATAFDADARETKNINDLIKERFSAIDANVSGLNNNFVTQIETDNAEFLETFNVIQQLVVLYKTNALSALDIKVDFKDNDGD
mgnify:CR=1 FL=1